MASSPFENGLPSTGRATGCPARTDQSPADVGRGATGVRVGVLSSTTALMKISGNQNSIGMTLSLQLCSRDNLLQNLE
jgi:hypothetical protein